MKKPIIKIVKNKYSVFFAAFAFIAGFLYLWLSNSNPASASWWNETWLYRNALVINHAKVAGDLTNFPMLVSLTDTSLGSHAQSDGDDIIFIDSEGKKLSHEIESFATSTGALVAWVKIPSLSSTDDQTIYMYYGNASVGSQQDRVNVWDSTNEAVWHFYNSASASTTDSTSNSVWLSANEGASLNTTGRFGAGFQMDSNGESLSFEENGQIDSQGSISFWYKETTNCVGYNSFFAADDSEYRFTFYRNNSDIGSSFAINDTQAFLSNINFFNGTWYYITLTWDDPANERKLFVNGSQQDSTNTDSFILGSITNFIIGENNQFWGQPINGIIDDFKIANAVRSNNWIQTEYANQNDPASFLLAQSEETGPGPVGYWSFDEGWGVTVYDDSGQGNDGTITGATWQDESMCVAGKCLAYNGTSDYVNLGQPSSSTFNSEHTICAWVKPLSIPNSSESIIVANSHDSSYVSQYSLEIENDRSVALFWSPGSGSFPNLITPANTIIFNQWYLICAVHENLTEGTIYINGNPVSTTFNSGGDNNIPTTGFGNTSIGKAGSVNNGYFHGFIDEVKIYPYARSADQIKQDYNAGMAGMGASAGSAFGSRSEKWMTDGLVGYWKMDESATTSGAVDSSGNGNDGTYYGHASTTGGKFGNGGVFDGVNDGITLPDVHVFGDSMSNGTFSAWVKLNTSSGCYDDGNFHMLFNGSYGSSDNFYIGYDGGSDTSWKFRLTGNEVINEALYGCAQAEDVQDWSLMTVTWTTNGILKMYQDGELVAQNSDNNITVNSVAIDYRLAYDGYNYLNGQIDEVRIYNRALSPDEVRRLYEWAPGPVLHLKMDEKQGSTANDTSGYGNDGLLGGGIASQQPLWDQGKYGSSLKFDGVNDVTAVSNSQSLNFGMGGFTVSYWVKLLAYPIGQDGNTGGAVTKQDTNSYSGWSSEFDGGGILHFYVDDGLSEGKSVTDSAFSLNTWYHVTALVDRTSGFQELYVNGIRVDQDWVPENSVDSQGGQDLLIGSWRNDMRFLNGLIDDVRVYNYARTQKQILEDMSAGAPGPYPLAHWTFDEGYGGTAHNKGFGGNALDGTLYPGTTGDNTATSAMWSLDGKNGKAMEFDGTDDYVNMPGFAHTFDELSVSAWVKIPYGSDGHIVDFGADGAGRRFGLSFENPNIYTLELNGGTDGSASIATDAGQWRHILGIWKKGQIASIYIDGELKNSDTTSILSGSLEIQSGDDKVIGSRFSRDSYFMEGLIDEVKIYNYALTEDEVKLDYNQGKSVVMGSVGGPSTATSSNAASLEYCVPGSTDYCAAPVGEWKMDEKSGATAYDTSGNGNNGSIAGASWARGKLGGALEFDNINSHMMILNSSSIGQGGSAITVSAWIRLNDANDANLNGVISKYREGAGWLQWLLYRDSSTYDRRLVFDIWNTSNVNGEAVSDSPFPNDTNWHYITGVYNGSTVSIYGDGVSLDSTSNSLTGAINNSSQFVCLGSLATGAYCDPTAGYAFDGLIDNVRIYNYARTPAQIAWEYNKGKPIAHWKFDECQGGVIHDASKNGNVGQLYLGTSGVTATGTCASSTNSFWYNGRTGHLNSAGSFDGTSDFISMGTGFDVNVPFSISAWVKPDDFDDFGTIIAKRDSWANGQTRFQLQLDSPDGSVLFGSYDGMDNFDYAPALGQWTLLTVVADSMSVKLYVNGQYKESSDAIVLDSDTTAVTRIGSCNGEDYFDGQIDDVRIYNYALTPLQVKTLYNDNSAVNFK